MWLNDRTRSPISPLATSPTRWSYLPFAISSIASPSASTGRVICLDRNSASQTLEKNTNTVISSSSKTNMVRIWLRFRNSSQYSSAPARMRTTVWLNPTGIGSATTTTLPDAVADIPSAYSCPPTLNTASSPRRAVESRLADSGPRNGTAAPSLPSSVFSGSQGSKLAGLCSDGA